MIVELGVFDRVHKKMVDYGFIVRYPDGKDSIT
jgi:LAS superfamily LD-carboxypeptidase LdcB